MKKIKVISRTPLFRVTSLNSVSVLLKIGTGLITSKLLAVFVGPGGMALVGNLRNFLTSAETVSTLGFQNGIVKYIVEHKDDQKQLQQIIATIFFSLIAVTLLLSGILFFLATFWNDYLFGSDYKYAVIFKVLALALPWYATTVFLLAAINGLGKFRNVISINIAGNIIGLLFALVAIWKLGTFGAMLSVIIPPSLLFFVAFYYINKEIRFWNALALESFDWQIIRNLSAFSVMTLVSSVCGPLVFLSIRNHIIDTLGVEQAGFWEAINRLSVYYMMFVSSILSLYFFPKLAFAKNDKATRNVVRSYYKNILPLFIIGMIALYLVRYYVVWLLFTNDFLPVAGLFFWQLIGDVFKTASLILGYQFFARRLTVAFIVTELFSLAMMYFFSRFLISAYGIEGVVMAHALTYFIYLLMLGAYFKKKLF